MNDVPIRFKKIWSSHHPGCIFLLSLYYLRKWCRGEGRALIRGGLIWHYGLGGEHLFGGGCLLQHGYSFWGNILE